MNRFPRVLTTSVAGIGLAFGAMAAGMPAAVAGTPNHVTKAEFNRVNRGMAMKKVHSIFDIGGKQTWYDGGIPGKYGMPATQSRDYRVQSKWGSVTVDYKKVNGTWKVTGKSAYWDVSAPRTANKVTKAELGRVTKGTTMKQAHRIFGTTGTQTWYDSGIPGKYGMPATQTRDYPVQSKWGSVTVDYKLVNGAWKVTSKSAYWG